MTKFIQFLTLASALVFVSSCGKKDDDPDPIPATKVAKARFMNTCISSSALKVSLNNTPVSSITGLSYLQSTGYLDLAPATGVTTSFVLQTSNVNLVEAKQDYTVNTYYSVFATGIVNTPSIFVTTDDMSVSATTAKVRFINLSPDNLNEDVYVGDKKIDSAVVYKEATAFNPVNPGTYKIILQDPNDVPSGITLPSQAFAAGKIYTIILTGLKGGSGDAQLKATVITNN